ncbi:DUF397 domain-containing protein [Streptomyces sp. NPDC057555]|uniref:DUF397 domain-containing protein n=1 Tax=Streptomyces sp. NPDC057555 TaxID=3346166 RepID=UPI0036BB8864
MTDGTHLGTANWYKSSYSSGGDNCVEVAELQASVAIRDSKIPQGPVLDFPPTAFAAFVADIRTAS